MALQKDERHSVKENGKGEVREVKKQNSATLLTDERKKGAQVSNALLESPVDSRFAEENIDTLPVLSNELGLFSVRILNSFCFGSLRVRYLLDEQTQRVGLMMFPDGMEDQIVQNREMLDEPALVKLPAPWSGTRAWEVESLVQVQCSGHEYPNGYAQGISMRNGESTQSLYFEGQRVYSEEDRLVVQTKLKSKKGFFCFHYLEWKEGENAIETYVTFVNESQKTLRLEMLSSFSLSGITPFHPADAPNHLVLHRIRSAWSAEGRLESMPLEQLHLERSWQGHSVRCERFGQVGSMPARGFFPFVAVEDKVSGVCWGAQLAWAGSWQMEAYRQNDNLSLSGGLADREFGHWYKDMAPGESIETPKAILSVVRGNLEELCYQLTSIQHHAADQQPKIESELPIIFNEFCSSWGNPTHDRIIETIDTLKGTGICYYVIDAGWYADNEGEWISKHGDWLASSNRFPKGLKALSQEIRKKGLIPGLWFELETCGSDSTAFSLVDHLLKRDGAPITVGNRRFWDMNDSWVVDYLSKRVIHLLKDAEFGYLKIDYNETIGIGIDGEESLGEGLRKQILGVYRFLDRLRSALPDLVIESCSSGGHRLEPSMLAATAMSSFSDAHEIWESPILAANVHRVMLPRQSQIWAVLEGEADEKRFNYVLATTFLGRMCLSGEVKDLTEWQWKIVHHSIALYKKAQKVIKRGKSFWYGSEQLSYRYPTGWQGVLRVSEEGDQILVVIHSFAQQAGDTSISLPLPRYKKWKIQDRLVVSNPQVRIINSQLFLNWDGEWNSAVLFLEETHSD